MKMRLLTLLLMVACGGEVAPSDSVTSTTRDGLRDPSLATEQAPDEFRARFTTTKGDFVILAKRKWSPLGVDRLYNLIRVGYFRDVPFYRVMPGFVAQFGFHYNPEINRAWKSARIKDEPNKVSNFKGFISFAKSNERDSRTTQLFINLANNAGLDRQGFATVAEVIEGMDSTIAKLNAEYGQKPSQQQIANEGIKYLQREFPRLDYIQSATILE